MMPSTTIDDPGYVKAMSHPLRVRLLAMLQEQDASPVELADYLDVSLGVVAYHVRTLHQLGLIELVSETRKRGAIEHHYRATHRPRISDEAWGKASAMAKQAAIGSSLQMIYDYARASAGAGGFDRSDAHLTRTTLRLDEKGWKQLAKICTRLLEQIDRIDRDAATRIGNDPHPANVVDTAVVMMVFESVRLSQQPAADGRPSSKRQASNARRPRASRSAQQASR
jgi:DNA-binding transcriptional ArsR family regulator